MCQVSTSTFLFGQAVRAVEQRVKKSKWPAEAEFSDPCGSNSSVSINGFLAHMEKETEQQGELPRPGI